VVYGWDLLLLLLPYSLDARLSTVHQQLLDHDEFLMQAREQLEQFQHHYKLHYDSKHRDLQFNEGDWVWLHLLHHPVASLKLAGRGKPGPKFFGPFQVVDKVGDVMYKLQLSAGAKIHDVFHVGLLKPFHSTPPSSPRTLPPLRHGCAYLEPLPIIKSRLARGKHDVLVQWKGLPAAESSWVTLDEFRQLYPSFHLEDKLIVQGGRDVMWGLQYSRHGKKQNKPAATGAGGFTNPGAARD
jgi:hypothetical protein